MSWTSIPASRMRSRLSRRSVTLLSSRFPLTLVMARDPSSGAALIDAELLVFTCNRPPDREAHQHVLELAPVDGVSTQVSSGDRAGQELGLPGRKGEVVLDPVALRLAVRDLKVIFERIDGMDPSSGGADSLELADQRVEI